MGIGKKGWPRFLVISEASIKINKQNKLEEMWDHWRYDTSPAEQFRAKINALTLMHLHGA